MDARPARHHLHALILSPARPRWQACAWVACIALLYLAADGFYVVERWRWIGSAGGGALTLADQARRGVFVLQQAMAVALVCLLARQRPRLALPALGLFGLFFLMDLGVHAAIGRPASLSNITVLHAAAGHLDHALGEFRDGSLRALLWTLAVVGLLAWRTWRGPVRAAAVPVMALLLSLLGLYGAALWVRGEQAVIGFPKGFAYGFGSLAVAANEGALAWRGQGGTLVPVRDLRHAQRKVVLVIDESIRQDEFARLLLPLIPPGSPRVLDYGLAWSGANCSAASNYILRRAAWARSAEAKAALREVESLFSLARRAGYATAYVEAQNVLAEAGARNYFDQAELARIDRVVRVEGPAHARDDAALAALRVLLRQPRVFVVVNKTGAHFPYAQMVPPAQRTGRRIDDYRTAVRLNSVAWLARLQAGLDAQTLAFYTSDHGQDFQRRAPHCNTGADVSLQEYAVPFLVLAGRAGPLAGLRPSLGDYRDRLSHLEVSESVRNALGFRLDFADSIFKPPRRLGLAPCGIHGPPKPFFGMGPRCKPLHLPAAQS